MCSVRLLDDAMSSRTRGQRIPLESSVPAVANTTAYLSLLYGHNSFELIRTESVLRIWIHHQTQILSTPSVT